MESLIHENFRNGTDKMPRFTIGEVVKFKYGFKWLYGIIDSIDGEWCEVSYGSEKTMLKFLRRECNLDLFCDVPLKDLYKTDLKF